MTTANPIRCPSCLKVRKVEFSEEPFVDSVSGMTLLEMPRWCCPTCGIEELDPRWMEIVRGAASEGRIHPDDGPLSPLEKYKSKPLAYCEGVNLDYDPRDYHVIPGLWRPQDDFFLLPVFFTSDALIKYQSDPKYQISRGNDKYMSIYGPEWHIAFGRNRSDRLIMWLGDLDQLPKQEQTYLSSFNIPSDHDIDSDWYDGQIDVQWSMPGPEGWLLFYRSRTQQVVRHKRGFELYKLEAESRKHFDRIHRPIYWTNEELERLYLAIAKVFIESIEETGIQADLLKVVDAKEIKGLRNLKLMQKWLTQCLGLDGRTIMCPFFVAYDLRQCHAHLIPDESVEQTMDSIRDRLGLTKKADDKAIYAEWIKMANESFKQILTKIGGKEALDFHSEEYR